MTSELFFHILGMKFMHYALLAALLSSLACGIVGTLTSVNRLVFLSGGVAHAAYGGIGLAFFFSLPVLPTTLLFTLAAALAMAYLALNMRGKSSLAPDTAIGVLWAAGMAFGILLIDLSPGYKGELMSYLFGSILAVSRADLWLMAGLDGLIALTVALAYQSLLALSFDREFAQSRGLAVNALQAVLVAMSALTVVMLIRVVGMLLVMALFTIPPAIALRHSRSLAGMMCRAALLSLAFTVLGLMLATWFDLHSGSTIILTACAGFAASRLYTWVRRKVVKGNPPEQPGLFPYSASGS